MALPLWRSSLRGSHLEAGARVDPNWIASVRFTHDSPDFLCSSVCLAEPMPLDPTRMNDCQVRVSDDNQLCARTVCGWCSHGAPLVKKGGVVSRRAARYYPAFGSKSRHSICAASCKTRARRTMKNPYASVGRALRTTTIPQHESSIPERTTHVARLCAHACLSVQCTIVPRSQSIRSH